MKKLSRLVALLLALMLVVPSALAEDTLVTIDSNTYQTATTAVEADSTTSTNLFGELIVDYLNDMTVEERQTVLQNWNTSMGGEVGQMTLEAFQNYYAGAHADGNLICTCSTLDAYGNVTHDADCRWYFGNLPADEQYSFIANADAETQATYLKHLPTTETTFTNEATGISVSGDLPDGAVLTVVSGIDTSLVDGIISTDHYSDNTSVVGYDLSITWNGFEWEPDSAVYVTIPNVVADDAFMTAVDVFHLLDSAESIEDAGSYFVTTDSALLSAYESEVAAATAAGINGIAYTYMNQSNGVIVFADGSIGFTTNSFSTYFISTGDTEIIVSYGNSDMMGGNNSNNAHTVYVLQDSASDAADKKITVQIPSTNDNVTDVAAPSTDGSCTTSIGSEGTYTYTQNNSSQTGTQYVVTVDPAIAGTDVYTFSVTNSSSGMQPKAPGDHNQEQQSSTYTLTIIVAGKDDFAAAEKAAYLAGTVGHIQIDIESSAVILGYNSDNAVSLDFAYTASTKYVFTEVADPDSKVGKYYQMTYTIDGVDYTITVKVDESVTLPEGVTWAEIASILDITGIDPDVATDQSQISFEGTIPVGSKTNPIKYIITVETTTKLTPNGGSATEDVDIAISDTIGYWDSDNTCPGRANNSNWSNGSVISGSGIDLGKFSTGTVLGETTYYIVFSDLTKNVVGYTFDTEKGETKNYTFTVYRRIKGSSDAWTAFDTVTMTLSGNTGSTTLNTDASKYFPTVDGVTKDILDYEYKIVETGYTIAGYGCSNVIQQTTTASDNTQTVTTLTDGVFTWEKSENTTTKTITYYVKLTCTNTYTEAGLTVKKEVDKQYSGDTVPTDDTFTIRIQPSADKGIDTTGVTNADGSAVTNAYSYFNGGTYTYTQNGQSVTATVVDKDITTAYGYIDITLKKDESVTIKGLPNGTYTVQEQAAASEDDEYIYDVDAKSVTLSGNSQTVTVINTYKQTSGSLTVEKSVENTTGFTPAVTEFQFAVEFSDDSTYSYQKYNADGNTVDTATSSNTFTLTDGQYVTYIDIPSGVTYEVTETAVTGYTTTSTGSTGTITAAVESKAVFTNEYKTGTLTISKNVVGVLADKTWPFSFSVGVKDNTDTALTGYDYTITKADGTTVSGKTSDDYISLKHGESVIITGIPDGATYTVAEVDCPTSYVKTVDGSETGTIISATDATIAYTNTYQEGTLIIHKTGMTSGENAIFKVTQGSTVYNVVVANDGSATLLLPAGIYTLEEVTSWTGRYTSAVDSTKTDTDYTIEHGMTDEVTYKNTSHNEKWLTDEGRATNVFDEVVTTTDNNTEGGDQ